MRANEMLKDFINDLNNALKIDEERYTSGYDSETFRVVDREANDGFDTKITVIEDEYVDYNGTYFYTYNFGLQSVDLDRLDEYDFNEDDVVRVIKNYTEKISILIAEQKKEIDMRLVNLDLLINKINRNRYTDISSK